MVQKQVIETIDGVEVSLDVETGRFGARIAGKPVTRARLSELRAEIRRVKPPIRCLIVSELAGSRYDYDRGIPPLHEALIRGEHRTSKGNYIGSDGQQISMWGRFLTPYSEETMRRVGDLAARYEKAREAFRNEYNKLVTGLLRVGIEWIKDEQTRIHLERNGDGDE